MLARSITLLGLCCLALCACKPKAAATSKCSTDGGCPDASVCQDGGACAAAERVEPGGRDDATAAGSGGRGTRTRTQAARSAQDAGSAEAAADAAQAAPARDPSKPKATPMQPAAAGASAKAQKPQAGRGGSAGSAMMQPEKPAQAGQGGAVEACDEACRKACEDACEPCQACGADNKTCEPVSGTDDADSCSDGRSCSSRSVCLNVAEAQTELGATVEWAELTTAYAQVIDFSEPATIEEMRLEVSCTENDHTFPPVWIVAAPGGVPSNNTIATANAIYQPPTDKNSFALLELSKALREPDAGPIAIVVGMSSMSCIVRVNSDAAYPGGGLFMQTSTGLWLQTEGSMVFQVLSSL